MSIRADFTSQNFFRDPAAAIEKLRATGPIVEVRLPIFGRAWITTTHEMASRVLKDSRVFTLRNENGAVWMPGVAANVLPEKLDLERRPNYHLAFGTGIHFCLGHQLVRLEGKCALQALYERWPKLRLAVEPAQIRWRGRPGIRAIIKLPVAK